MKNLLKINIVILLLSVGILLTACNSNDGDDISTPASNARTQGIFTILLGDSVIEMNGVIGSAALNNFNSLYAAYPTAKKISIKECDGSDDDETNLKLSARVHQLNISTHLQKNGLIASGGVDFFLAGVKRTKGDNTKIGVHAWASNGGSVEATDFPPGHANHLPYINYYVSIGFTQQQAEDFYYFTINAAPASSIHWMTDAEIQKYNILK